MDVDCGPDCDCDACLDRDREASSWRELGSDADLESWKQDSCCLGAACLNPHPYHLACECFDAEMAETFMSDGAEESKP